MTQRVTVILANRRVFEKHGPMYFENTTRSEARKHALSFIDDLKRERESLPQCRVTMRIVSFRDSAKVAG
jgi:hypothetical protein